MKSPAARRLRPRWRFRFHPPGLARVSLLLGGLLATGLPAGGETTQEAQARPATGGTTAQTASQQASGESAEDPEPQPPSEEAISEGDSPSPAAPAPSVGETPDDGDPVALPPADGANAVSVARGDTTENVAALIRRIEDHHRSLPHFAARFEQRFTPRIFGRERVETGTLRVRNPGRMRWEYDDPEPKVFVTDGETTWFHVPADQQVVVGALGTDEGAAGRASPLRILTGEAAILDHFDAFLAGNLPSADDGAAGLTAVLLSPREPGEIASLRLEVEEGSGRIEAIATEDPEGNRTEFRFSDFTFGDLPPDSLFRFTIPPGTEVLTAGAGSGNPR